MGPTVRSGRNGSLNTVPFLLPILSLVVFSCVAVIANGFGIGRWRVFNCLGAWMLLSGSRLQNGDGQAIWDCAIFYVAGIWTFRQELLFAYHRGVGHGINVGATLMWIFFLGVLPCFLFGFLIGLRGSSSDDGDVEGIVVPAGARKWALENEHPNAYILPSKTTHARIFPKKHSFGYSYLLCGFPIVPAFVLEDGQDVGDGEDKRLGSWWLGIRAKDYLFRGQGGLGFYGKLRTFLREENVEDTEWSYAYLVTAARFFGYAFNPVSFWYIYDRNHELKKMILEVNNTFGERRIYLLDGSSPPTPPTTPEPEPLADPNSSNTKFTDVWTKDFHVSPFNSRKGSYSLKAHDPFSNSRFRDPKIDNTITLKSSRDHAKIVARVFTTGKPIEFASMGLLESLRFVCSWWWVGFVTFPRIVREAGKLFFKKGLHVWFRPEVQAPSIGRIPTQIEDDLQRIFQDYITHIVGNSCEAIEIDYKTAIPSRPQQTIRTAESRNDTNDPKKVQICILTPAFYSRFVHYAHTSEALDRECLFTDLKNRTLWISDPDVLKLFSPPSSGMRIDKNLKINPEQTQKSIQLSFLDKLRWNLLRKLRCPPPDPAYAVTPQCPGVVVHDIRTLPFSELDGFVRVHGRDAGYSAMYRKLVTKIFVAQRFAFGFTEVVSAVDFLVRGVLCYLGVRELWSIWLRAWGEGGVGVEMDWDWRLVVLGMLGVCGCHLYGMLKG